jgi:hypothetical protein
MSTKRMDYSPIMSRRHFGALAAGAAATSLMLSSPARLAAQQVNVATKLASGVATNPQDRVVLAWKHPDFGGRFLLVITEAGAVYGHELVEGGRTRAPWRIGKIEPVDGNVRWVFADAANFAIYVVRKDGTVEPYTLSLDAGQSYAPNGIAGPSFMHMGGPVGTNPADRHALLLRDRLIVFRSDGATGFHHLEAFARLTRGVAAGADSYRPVASNPQDKWIVPLCGNRIGVVTASGELFVHVYDFGRNIVLPPTRANTLQRIAANPQDRFVVSDGSMISVVTSSGDVYGHAVGC